MNNSKFNVSNCEFVCHTPKETFALGEEFGAALQGGEVVLLSGELGAGKTLFVKGVMNALEYDVIEVTSPSFTLVNIYKANLKVYHLDLYRLSAGHASAYAVDLDEILQDAHDEAAVFIEWAERLRDFPLPDNTLQIRIEGDGDEARTIKIVWRKNANLQS